MEPNKGKSQKKTLFVVINMMMQFFIETFVAMIIGYIIGRYLDTRLFEDQSILTYVFIVLGIFAGMRNLIKRALKYSDGGEENEKD